MVTINKNKKLIYTDLSYLDLNKDTCTEYATPLKHQGKIYPDIYITNIGRIFTTNPAYVIDSESFHKSKSKFQVYYDRIEVPFSQDIPYVEGRLSNAIKESFVVKEYRRINYRLAYKGGTKLDFKAIKLCNSLIDAFQVYLCDNYKEDSSIYLECNSFLSSYLTCKCKQEACSSFSKGELLSFLHGAYIRHTQLYKYGFKKQSYSDGIEEFKEYCQLLYEYPGLVNDYRFTLYSLPDFFLCNNLNLLLLTKSFGFRIEYSGGTLNTITRSKIIFSDIFSSEAKVFLYVYGYKAIVENPSKYYRVVPIDPHHKNLIP